MGYKVTRQHWSYFLVSETLSPFHARFARDFIAGILTPVTKVLIICTRQMGKTKLKELLGFHR